MLSEIMHNKVKVGNQSWTDLSLLFTTLIEHALFVWTREKHTYVKVLYIFIGISVTYLMTPHVRLLFGWLVGWLLEFPKWGRKFHFHAPVGAPDNFNWNQ